MIESILNAVKSVVEGLNLTIDNQDVTVVKEKAPVFREGLDANRTIYVSKSEKPETITRWTFRKYRTEWFVDVTLVAPEDDSGNAHSLVRASITAAFSKPTLAGVTGVFDAEVMPADFLGREALEKNFGTQVITLRFSTVTAFST